LKLIEADQAFANWFFLRISQMPAEQAGFPLPTLHAGFPALKNKLPQVPCFTSVLDARNFFREGGQ